MPRPAVARRLVIAMGSSLLLGAVVGSVTAQPPYRAPRTPDGQPDLQGIWQTLNTAEWDIQDHGAHLGVPAGRSVVADNEIPYQPWALAQKNKNFKNRATADPVAKCFFPGVPRIMYIPHPFQIVQTPTYMAMLYEFGHHERLIYTDGFPHHEDIPFWMGDSRGKWDGETFVIDTTNFNDETWFDQAGNFHSDQLHLTERLTRGDADHLTYEVRVEDPKVFTRPWLMRMPLYRRVEPDAQLLEYECYALSLYEGGKYDKAGKAPPRRAPPAATGKPAKPAPTPHAAPGAPTPGQ